MEGLSILLVITLLLGLIGSAYYFGDRIRDAFSPTHQAYGLVKAKEYITPKSKIVMEKEISDHDSLFGRTMREVHKEVFIPEKCILHIQIDRMTIATPVSSKVFDSVNQGDHILVKYARGRYSNNLYLKKVGGAK